MWNEIGPSYTVQTLATRVPVLVTPGRRTLVTPNYRERRAHTHTNRMRVHRPPKRRRSPPSKPPRATVVGRFHTKFRFASLQRSTNPVVAAVVLYIFIFSPSDGVWVCCRSVRRLCISLSCLVLFFFFKFIYLYLYYTYTHACIFISVLLLFIKFVLLYCYNYYFRFIRVFVCRALFSPVYILII